MKVIEKPQRVHAFNGTGVPLLPVNPPEIHTLPLQRAMEQVKVYPPERPVFRFKRNPLTARSIPSHRGRSLWIGDLVRLYPLRGVQVERYPESLLVKHL